MGMRGERPSGAKARGCFAEFVARLKSCPFKASTFAETNPDWTLAPWNVGPAIENAGPSAPLKSASLRMTAVYFKHSSKRVALGMTGAEDDLGYNDCVMKFRDRKHTSLQGAWV
jgi:hypothetical protein